MYVDKRKYGIARSWFDLLYNWPPNSELLNNSLLELVYFLSIQRIKSIYEVAKYVLA